MACLVATCARGGVGCEFATHCAASQSANWWAGAIRDCSLGRAPCQPSAGVKEVACHRCATEASRFGVPSLQLAGALARGEAHIERRSHAHCKSGRRSNWFKNCRSVCIRLSANAAMKCGWPMPRCSGCARRMACFPARRERPARRFLVETLRRHDSSRTAASPPRSKYCNTSCLVRGTGEWRHCT